VHHVCFSILLWCLTFTKLSTVEPGYNDSGLCDTSSITSDILFYKLIPPYYPQRYSPRLEQLSFVTLEGNSTLFYAVIQPSSSKIILKLTVGFGGIFVSYKDHKVVQVCYGSEHSCVSDR
jgi:hypothetical protein